MNRVNRDAAIYIAAFWEAEGWAGVYKHKSHRTDRKRPSITMVAKIGISQADRSILDWIRNQIGCGAIHQTIKPTENRKGIWTLRLASKSARDFLRLIEPHTRFRKKQINQILLEQVRFGNN